MSHDTHTGHDKETERKKSTASLSSSFWFIVILVILFIGAVNFVNVMGHSEEAKEPQKTEAPAAPGVDEKHTPVENQIPNVDSGHQMSSDSAASK